VSLQVGRYFTSNLKSFAGLSSHKGYFMVGDHRPWICIPVFWDGTTMVHHHTFFTQTSDQEVRYTVSSHPRNFCTLELTTKLGYFCHIIVIVDINMKDRLVG
jgi:hypothetical protein